MHTAETTPLRLLHNNAQGTSLVSAHMHALVKQGGVHYVQQTHVRGSACCIDGRMGVSDVKAPTNNQIYDVNYRFISHGQQCGLALNSSSDQSETSAHLALPNLITTINSDSVVNAEPLYCVVFEFSMDKKYNSRDRDFFLCLDSHESH